MAYIRKLKSGRFQVQIRIKGLKTISKTFTKKTDAVAFAKEVEYRSELALAYGLPTTGTATFRQFVDTYMESYEGKDSSTIGRLIYWCDRFGLKEVTQVTAEDVDDGLIELSGRVSGSTVNRYKSTLSAVFIHYIQHPNYKKHARLIGFTNPVHHGSISKFKENPPKDRFLSYEEQRRLLEACRDASWPRLYLFVLMAITTGARKGNILNLKWKDIDFVQRTAFIGKTKSGRRKYLPLTKTVIEEMIKYRDQSNFLIFHSTVSRTTAYDLSKQWSNAVEKAGIGYCRIHDLRHTAASNLVRAGRSLFEVGTLLDHSTPQMTQRYAHLAIDDTQAMVEQVMGDLS